MTAPAHLPTTRRITHWIDGRDTPPSAARTAPVYGPSLGRPARDVELGSAAEVHAAVASALTAQSTWAAIPPLRRGRVLNEWRRLIEAHSAELARLISEEHGKLEDDARGELQRGLEVVEFASGIPHLLKGEFSEQVGTGIDSYSLRQPLGVCVGITPFNFPAMIPLWMAPVALACGNTFVLKPSEKDPSCPRRLAELATEAGLPAGALNVVNGDHQAVDALLRHPDVAAISFVGSTKIARSLYERAAREGKRVQALGGAKNHAVVLPDADLEQAADALVGAAFGSAGERCMAISVVVAVGTAGDALLPRLKSRAERLRLGARGDAADMGPLVTAAHCAAVRGYVEAGVREGAVLVVDGRGGACADRPDGFYLGPTVFDAVTPDMSIYRDEIFGPVLCVVRAATLAEALALVDAHPFGNGAAIFTMDGRAARTFAHRVPAGMVGVNVPIPVPMAFHSFGGWKQSAFGSAAMHGMEGVRFYTRLKTVTARWPEAGFSAPEFAMPTAR